MSKTPTRLLQAEYVTSTWHHTPQDGVSLKDIQEPAYWAHVAKTLKPCDKIEIIAEDGSWWALLLVRMSGNLDAQVAVLQHKTFDDAVADGNVTDDYKVEWKGPNLKWTVLRLADNERVADGMGGREEADAWITNRRTAQAA